MRTRLAWQREELDIITANYVAMPWVELLSLLPNRTKHKIQDKANQMGLVRYRKPARTYQEMLAAKRLGMARARSTPDGRERQRLIQKRAYEADHGNRARMYRAELKVRHFFRHRAQRFAGNGADEPIKANDIAMLWKRQGGRCALTGRKLGRDAQLDHILPLARGGRTLLANLRWTCPEVNIAKRHLSDDEFHALCADVIRWLGRRIEAVDAIMAAAQAPARAQE